LFSSHNPYPQGSRTEKAFEVNSLSPSVGLLEKINKVKFHLFLHEINEGQIWQSKFNPYVKNNFPGVLASAGLYWSEPFTNIDFQFLKMLTFPYQPLSPIGGSYG
jgi:hypothetical protein